MISSPDDFPDPSDHSKDSDPIQPDSGPGKIYEVAKALYPFELTVSPFLKHNVEEMLEELLQAWDADGYATRPVVWRLAIRLEPAYVEPVRLAQE